MLSPQRPSGQAVVTSVFPSPPPVRAFIFIAHRGQRSHFSLIFCLSSLRRIRLLERSRTFGLSMVQQKERAPCGTRTYDLDLNSYTAYY